MPHGDFQVICSIRLLRGDAGTAAALTVYLRHGIYGEVDACGESVGYGVGEHLHIAALHTVIHIRISLLVQSAGDCITVSIHTVIGA